MPTLTATNALLLALASPIAWYYGCTA